MNGRYAAAEGVRSATVEFEQASADFGQADDLGGRRADGIRRNRLLPESTPMAAVFAVLASVIAPDQVLLPTVLLSTPVGTPLKPPGTAEPVRIIGWGTLILPETWIAAPAATVDVPVPVTSTLGVIVVAGARVEVAVIGNWVPASVPLSVMTYGAGAGPPVTGHCAAETPPIVDRDNRAACTEPAPVAGALKLMAPVVCPL